MIQGIMVGVLFLGALIWTGKRLIDRVQHKKAPGCEKCGQPIPHKT